VHPFHGPSTDPVTRSPRSRSSTVVELYVTGFDCWTFVETVGPCNGEAVASVERHAPCVRNAPGAHAVAATGDRS